MEKIALDGQLPPYFTKIHGKYGLQNTQRTLWKRFDGLLSKRSGVQVTSPTLKGLLQNDLSNHSATDPLDFLYSDGD